MTEADEVLDSYKRDLDRDTERTLEDALREERDEARSKLRDIAVMLGCHVDKIIPVLTDWFASFARSDMTGEDL